ncbi:MerR family transcriptional regulator [Paracoccus sp. P2]|uniref:MerR family transcriptional regulator n=1 Tax=Paracoccus pantotrophus TaxID=82367 RepID=A0A7H9BVN6_PARPN|nr:MerR family transcriptional regulator [Paracoccus pantotrophus]MDF3853002.1 MerR family transcriptional regulator [Paracoccus pantotrophus]QLH13911.1 MerR family transcriptional regulator [Paracoccus pantotrophus]RDE01001.1 MerR family transcriptional regulator [Paracoccus pantotrophus]RNI17470.1 MerR family transcriptional regulator [Paracoccus pantotrophus]WGR66958.1 MerR family transcriptional regulator [Paracoccus pantotrophus]
MSKSPDAFRSIGEVSRLVGVAPHVLRYWESQFTQLAPVKRADGRRYYRPEDVRLAAGLCQVMREEGLSIRGAKRLIAADRGAALREIGAARLGETLGEAGAVEHPGPAVRLALPERDAVPRDAKAVLRPARPNRPEQQAESLPLFAALDPGRDPAPDWLGRLVATALALRQFELQGKPLPAQAKTLRDALTGAR